MAELKENSSAKRFRMLDLLRGVTVLFMIAAHAVYFFHNDTSSILGFVENAGNTIAFTVFLIISGATAEIAYFSREEDWPERKKRLIKRVLVLLTGYFILALMVFYPTIASTYGLDRLKLIFDILTLRSLAPFAEFYIPFIVFPLVIASMPRFFKTIKRSVYVALLFGLAIYLLGTFYYQLSIWEFILPWKALLFGAPGYYRFPIFQYFPVYLLGMVWGNQLLSVKKIKHQAEIVRAILATSILVLIISATTIWASGNSFDNFLRRWPPSVPFLLIGISFAALLAAIFYKTHQLKKRPLLRDGLLILGQNALGLALTHVFLLQIYSLSGGLKTGSILLYLFSFLVLMLLSLALAAIIPFNFRLSLNLERGQCNEHKLEEEALVQFEEEFVEEMEGEASFIKRFFYLGRSSKGQSQKLIKKRHVLGFSILLVLATLIVFPPIADEFQMRNGEAGASWFDNNYGWRQRITIKNQESLAEIPKGEAVSWQINQAELVQKKRAYPDGRDLRVLFWDGEGFKDVNFWIVSNENQSLMTITFQVLERLKPGDSTNNYYLFYGNNLGQSAAQSGEAARLTAARHIVSLDTTESHPFLLTVDRRWNLLTDDPKVPKTLRVALQTAENYTAEKAEFKIVGSNKKGELEKVSGNLWEGIIDTSGFNPGEYHLSATIESDGQLLETVNTGFYVSYPLYVAWTQDWEGYNVPDSYLSAITQIARDHGLAITHFWNPRLTTTTTITQSRKDVLVAWIKDRKETFGESIQLHLHMFNDFVTLSGVTPKNTPNWGDSGDGYGALTTNYDTSELTKMISKALEVMRASGLGTPFAYRAGGWFANEETLQAIENSGLKADSSGRTAYKFYQQTGPWNLAETAQPYYPSQSDQNKAGAPAFNILEIPNNGADSYWFSSDDMRKRFSANYGGGILTESRQITYLSHPHWFNKTEQGKVESVFNYIDNYKFDADNGPVLYVTLDEIYRVWTEK